MTDVQTLSVVIAAASVVVAAATLTQQSRETKRIRQDELFMPIYSRYQEKDFNKHWIDIMFKWEFEDYDDYMKKYGFIVNPEAHSSYLTVAEYFNCIGFLLKRKRLDLMLVDDLMRAMTINFWEKFESIIKEARKREPYPRLMHGAEYLYNEMKRREQLDTASR